MSKEKPEVGDVWKDPCGEKAHILWVGYIVVYVRKYWITNYEYHYEVCKLDYDKFLRKWDYFGKSKANIDDLFEAEEEWIPLSELGHIGTDFDLIPSNEFLNCVKAQGFIDDDGDGYPVIDNGTLLYNKKKSVYPSEIQNKDKLDFDYVAWFNK